MRLILVLLMFPTFAFAAPKPQRGDWVCWSTNIKKECGTYGWHKQKSVALKAAMDLCFKACGKGCAKDYCEILK